MESESHAAKELGLDWEVKLYCLAGAVNGCAIAEHLEQISIPTLIPSFVVKGLQWIRLRYRYYRWLFSMTDIDVYLLRYNVHDPFQAVFAMFSRKRVYFVHHAVEVPELRLAGGMSAWLRAPLERLIGPIGLRHVFGIIGVTDEIVEHEKHRISSRFKIGHVYPNGISYDSEPLPDNREGQQQWIFVSSYFYPWQGLDRLLASLRESDIEVTLHLVGELSEDHRQLLAGESRVVVHGELTIDEIKGVAGQCCVGVSSMALDRQGLEEACALKVREYLQMGLPVVAGYREVLPEGFPYFCNTGADVDLIFNFAQQLLNVDRQAISDDARPYIDKVKLLSKLHSEIVADM